MLPSNYAAQGCKNNAFVRGFLEIMLPRDAKTQLALETSVNLRFTGMKQQCFRSRLPSRGGSLQMLGVRPAGPGAWFHSGMSQCVAFDVRMTKRVAFQSVSLFTHA